MRRKTLSIRERTYLEDLKKAADTAINTKLKNVLLISDFCRYLSEKVKFKNNK